MHTASRFVLGVIALSLPACDQRPQQKAPEPAVTQPVLPVPPAPAAKVNLIREGVGVAGVELGMSSADVVRVLGTPSRVNKAGDRPVYMEFHPSEILGVYFDAEKDKVRMVIVARQDKTWCTSFDVCLYREGDLAKLKAHHGAKLLRFVDRDGSVTYRLLEGGVMTEYTPVEERNGVVQVAISTWSGPIDRSSFD